MENGAGGGAAGTALGCICLRRFSNILRVSEFSTLFHTGGVFASISVTLGDAFGGSGPAPTFSLVGGGFGGEGTSGNFGTFGRGGGTSGAPGTSGGELSLGPIDVVLGSTGRVDELTSPSTGEWKYITDHKLAFQCFKLKCVVYRYCIIGLPPVFFFLHIRMAPC